jgi:hypothetical protein
MNIFLLVCGYMPGFYRQYKRFTDAYFNAFILQKSLYRFIRL